MSSRTILIIIAVVVVIVVGSALIFFWHGSGTTGGSGGTTGGTGGTLPVTSTSTFPTSTTVTIGTSQGSVAVNNFYTNPALITPDHGIVVIVATTSYNIAYNVGDSTFSIALLSAPLGAARLAAEAALLAALNISQTDACKLTVYESVPGAISADYAGENLGLSFCPGAINL